MSSQIWNAIFVIYLVVGITANVIKPIKNIIKKIKKEKPHAEKKEPSENVEFMAVLPNGKHKHLLTKDLANDEVVEREDNDIKILELERENKYLRGELEGHKYNEKSLDQIIENLKKETKDLKQDNERLTKENEVMKKRFNATDIKKMKKFLQTNKNELTQTEKVEALTRAVTLLLDNKDWENEGKKL